MIRAENNGARRGAVLVLELRQDEADHGLLLAFDAGPAARDGGPQGAQPRPEPPPL